MDEILNQRLASISARLDALEQHMAGVDVTIVRTRDELRDHVSSARDELLNHSRQLEMRVTTEIHALMGAIRDLRDWMKERDATAERLKQLEERMAKYEQGPGAPPPPRPAAR